MTDPITFPNSTARFDLPLLHVAQAQKELFVNEALVRADVLLQSVVLGQADSPPSAPEEGDCWIVSISASGEFAGQDGKLACWQQGQWLFIQPRDGMRVFDRNTGADRRFDGGWSEPNPIALPAGGATVDVEARAAIASLVIAMQNSGAVPGA